MQEPEITREVKTEWLKWIVTTLGSALATTALGAWYMATTLSGINEHLTRLDNGQQDIMAQHQALSWQLDTVKANQLIVITMLHDEHPDKVPLPDTSDRDGFRPTK